MKLKTTYDYYLPDFMLCPIVNGDFSGLNDEDINLTNKAIDTFHKVMKKEAGTSYTIDIKNDSTPFFTWSPDFIAVGCNVYDISLNIFV